MMVPTDEVPENNIQEEHETPGGRAGKVLLVASPFLFLLAFLLLESWIRGRF
jgi:hypothetical protein